MAHHRKPVVTIGARGLTDAVAAEVDQALTHHELVKIKLPAVPAKDRRQLVESLCSAVRAEFVQSIGRTGVIYRQSDPPAIELPGA